mmetsp:Transcript_23460/g.20396  ORF Transcript_23460/g.20396 Transcript_23460/m.20396 type:complete len:147 (+) Transcript_23460:1-441(+)
MKQKDLLSREFLEVILMAEQSMNRNLIRPGGYGKFMFRDTRGKWFYVYKDCNEGYKVQYIKHGFQNHFSDVFKQKNQLYHAKDVLYGGKKAVYEDVATKLYETMAKIANNSVDNCFLSYKRYENMWDIYACPFEIGSSHGLRMKIF